MYIFPWNIICDFFRYLLIISYSIRINLFKFLLNLGKNHTISNNNHRIENKRCDFNMDLVVSSVTTENPLLSETPYLTWKK